MKIVFAASEVVPFAKTGGLADVVGTLPHKIQALGHEVLIFLPRYKCVDKSGYELRVELDRLAVPIGSEKETGRILTTEMESGVRVYLVDQPEYFMRDALYGTPLGDYPDNDKRFIFFQRAVLETLKTIKFKADILHCHDWQTGLIPVLLKSFYAKDKSFRGTKTVFTIHNLAYQGNFPPDSLPATGLGWDQFRINRLEYYGKFSFMKAGILDADAVTTVSERYAREIQTKEFGCGMEGVLAGRHDRLFGIINGIEPSDWDPKTDKDLVEKFSVQKLAGKAANKAALQKENGFEPDPKHPLVGFVARLASQKGVDILVEALPEIMRMGAQLVLLGTGDEKYHHLFRQFSKQYHGQCGIHILFDLDMAKRIYASCDFMLFPSYYEPCGLGHLIAMRFGTIPVVRETGGLADTVEEFSASSKTGNGFRFETYSGGALLEAVKRCCRVYEDREAWTRLMQNAMNCDFSWEASAGRYVQVYENIFRGKVKGRGK